MLKSHEKFHSVDGRRLILVVDDEPINRFMLGNILSSEYEVIYAGNGREAMELILKNQDMLSLVLLDLLMPEVSGIELLQRLKADTRLQRIPVIVLTSEQRAEVESLHLGASDFIPKPYPDSEVILARVLRTIELSEDREIIQSTERDTLTGLYNREYFYRYAEQFDQHHRDLEMDAIVVDVNHFHMINERYGKLYGDDVLRRIGEKVREMVRDSGGIVCRREGDTFLIYCPHREDYRAILENASVGLAGEGVVANNRVRLRMGIYSRVDKSIDIERRFDRAKLAADTVRNNFTKSIALYDNALHESEIYSEQLLEDFHTAIAERQFRVFYQPKFYIQGAFPRLASAEALIRWQHPEHGMISPGKFIPLFEENGLIQPLDEYVWREAAAQVQDWKRRYGVSVPVSVNVSRIDMYDPDLVDKLESIREEFELTSEEYHLEITESAYTDDSTQIIDTVKLLREKGFLIEMDDFGTGYSSLGMISSLPIDALKLDMMFIRNAFSEQRDVRMLELVIDIADYLSVPVIAEGVETEEQMLALKEMGCDIVQGYYFSKPLPPEEFDRFVEEKIRGELEQPEAPRTVSEEELQAKSLEFYSIARALSLDFESIYYVNIVTDEYTEFAAQGSYEELQIETSGTDFFAECQRNLLQVVYEDDQPKVSAFLEKDRLLGFLEERQVYTLDYRLVIDGEPIFYRMKAVMPELGDRSHLVIGVSNIDAQARRLREYEVMQQDSVTYSQIAQALSQDYFTIYYVNTEDDRFIEYSTQGLDHQLLPERTGEGFFEDCKRSIPEVVLPEDVPRALEAFEKENLLRELEGDRTFSIAYRIRRDGEAVYTSLKALRLADDRTHIVIGMSDIDSRMKKEKEYEMMREESITYSRIARALAQNYFSLYYVDTKTDEFIEYSSHGQYQELKIERSGENFFDVTRKNILRVVYPEDRERALAIWEKEAMMRALLNDNVFSATYRLLFDDTAVYVNIKVMRMTDGDDHHIIVGVSNVDAQMRREKEFSEAQEMALRDALTGVRNKRAYTQIEQQLNGEIQAGSRTPFGIVVCDVNGLKTVNDTYGHAAGDRYIKDACAVICDIFKHSPVFRIGGDEFAAVLRGQDYEHRFLLLEELTKKNRESRGEGSVIIACGMSEYVPGEDTQAVSVFERADSAMYENKKKIKANPVE